MGESEGEGEGYDGFFELGFRESGGVSDKVIVVIARVKFRVSVRVRVRLRVRCR